MPSWRAPARAGRAGRGARASGAGAGLWQKAARSPRRTCATRWTPWLLQAVVDWRNGRPRRLARITDPAACDPRWSGSRGDCADRARQQRTDTIARSLGRMPERARRIAPGLSAAGIEEVRFAGAAALIAELHRKASNWSELVRVLLEGQSEPRLHDPLRAWVEAADAYQWGLRDPDRAIRCSASRGDSSADIGATATGRRLAQPESGRGRQLEVLIEEFGGVVPERRLALCSRRCARARRSRERFGS